MKCAEIIRILETCYPKTAALDFDNVGLQAGRTEKEVHRIFLALDATDEVIQMAVQARADMLITHHPLLFKPVKCVTDESFIGRRLVELIRRDICYYAVHTNYDVLGMAGLSAKVLNLLAPEVLDVTMEQAGKPEGIGRIGELKEALSLRECCLYVKQRFQLNNVKVFGDLNVQVKRLAVSPGAGKSAVRPALEKGADVLVTGDIGHHEGIDAVAQGLCIIDAGHYGTEYIFLADMKKYLNEKAPEILVETAPVVHPFQVI